MSSLFGHPVVSVVYSIHKSRHLVARGKVNTVVNRSHIISEARDLRWTASRPTGLWVFYRRRYRCRLLGALRSLSSTPQCLRPDKIIGRSAVTRPLPETGSSGTSGSPIHSPASGGWLPGGHFNISSTTLSDPRHLLSLENVSKTTRVSPWSMYLKQRRDGLCSCVTWNNNLSRSGNQGHRSWRQIIRDRRQRLHRPGSLWIIILRPPRATHCQEQPNTAGLHLFLADVYRCAQAFFHLSRPTPITPLPVVFPSAWQATVPVTSMPQPLPTPMTLSARSSASLMVLQRRSTRDSLPG